MVMVGKQCENCGGVLEVKGWFQLGYYCQVCLKCGKEYPLPKPKRYDAWRATLTEQFNL